MNLREALARIEELEDQIADLELEIDDLQPEDDDLYYEEDCPDLDEDPRYMEMREFIRDIGFDPDALPSSLGERMALCNLIAAARVLR